MSNIIGARIDKKLYDKIKNDSRSPSDIVRTALAQYYSKYISESNVNTSFTVVKQKEKTDEGEDIHSKVDALFRRFNK